MNLSILNNMLSLNNIWNNKNFLMALDRKPISYIDFSSQHLDISGNNLRPDINQYYNKIIIDDLKYIKRIGAILLKIDLNFLKIYMKYIVLLSMPNILSNDIFMESLCLKKP